jgi:hypothetical protein
MPNPHISSAFSDLVDRRVTKIFYDTYDQLPDWITALFSVQKSSDQYETSSAVGALQDFSAFSGQVSYQSQAQGYDVRATHVEFASGFQIERALFDDDRHNIWQGKPVALAQAANRTRQKHAARLLNNAFSVDTYFYNNSEGVALCSNSHTTTAQGVSTATGFDNLITSSLSAVAVASARIQMLQLRDDVGNRMAIMPNEIWIPVDLYEQAEEIVKSKGKLDTPNNNVNVHDGAYKICPVGGGWNYLTDTNNWFMCDGGMRKMAAIWYERVPLEFGRADEFDTFIMKHRAYMRYSQMWNDWRWIVGAQVS